MGNNEYDKYREKSERQRRIARMSYDELRVYNRAVSIYQMFITFSVISTILLTLIAIFFTEFINIPKSILFILVLFGLTYISYQVTIWLSN